MNTLHRAAVAAVAAAVAVLGVACVPATPSKPTIPANANRTLPSAVGLNARYGELWEAVVNPATRPLALAFLYGPLVGTGLVPRVADWTRFSSGARSDACRRAAIRDALWLIRWANDNERLGAHLGHVYKLTFKAAFKAIPGGGALTNRVNAMVDLATSTGLAAGYRGTASSQFGATRITCGA